MKQDRQDFEEIVKRAQQAEPRERPELVRIACNHDNELIARVMERLNEANSAQAFWNAHHFDADATVISLEGQRLGPYKLLRTLGEGGMGAVYLAERADDEYHQRVAIKLVRTGMISPQMQGRLRNERQILATLQHPNIARLLDGGTAPDGTPYLVMEYIEGEPIDVYCDRTKLGIEQRLQLFRTVCLAVHYAHQNLVVHRDLKPNNILVTEDGTPKLLDFGIAKLLDARQVPLHTMAVTHVDFRMMTPAHASPEQVRGENITTASDIYVLGVLLYDLLTGQRPFRLHSGRFADIERIICEQPALAPSVAAERARRESPGVCEARATSRAITAARLPRRLRGDLDNIVLMAMRKEPERRYSSVEQFSADLGRHLDGLPVLATRDTWGYRTRKFAYRNSLAVSAGMVGTLLLCGFSIAMYVQAKHLAAERDVAAQERERAEQVSSFLVELFQLSDPSKSRGNAITARELLDLGARRVSSSLTNQPSTRTTLMGTIGQVYGSLGLYEEATRVLQESLTARQRLYGAVHPQVAEALKDLGDSLLAQGRTNEAEARLQDALRMQQQLHPADAVETAPVIKSLGQLAQERGALQVAEHHYRDALALYQQHEMGGTPQAAAVMNDLGSLLTYTARYDESAVLYRSALEIDRHVLGDDAPQSVLDLHNLALTLQLQGRLDQAQPAFEKSVALFTKVLGPEHPMTLDALSNYGRFLQRKGEVAQAEEVLRNVVTLSRKAWGNTRSSVGYYLVDLGMLLDSTHQFKEAEQQFRDALDIYSRSLPADHVYIGSALRGLGIVLLDEQRVAEAESLLRRSVEIYGHSLPSTSPQVAVASSALGRTLLATNRISEAQTLLSESRDILQRYKDSDLAAAHELEAVSKTLAAASTP